MNNRIQQRFDKSIREAVDETRRANEAKPRKDVTPPKSGRERTPKGRLYLCPQTGATLWEQAA